MPMATASLPWLIRHELRLAFRNNPARLRTRAAVLVALLSVPVLLGTALAWWLRTAPDVPEQALGAVSAAAALLVVLMLSGASVYVLRAFHDRGDLDLLLSSPVPPARVLAAKTVAVHAAVALPLLIILSPFLIASALFGHPGWLGGIVMIVTVAVLATSLAFGLATFLFRWLGPRRARRTIQIGGGVLAGTVAILGQSPTFAPRRFEAVRTALAAPPPAPLDWPGRAVFGAPLPLLALVAVATIAAILAARLAAGEMGRGQGPRLDEAATPAAARTRPAARYRAPLAIVLVKELQLLARDPELLASVALQLAYMVPAFGLIFAGGGVSPGRLAAAAVLFSALLPSSLAWLTICGEDAPDLVASAPVAPATIARAKILAACLPALVLVTPAILFIATQSLRAGLVAALLAPVAALAAAAQQHWLGRPRPRRTFRNRQQGSILLAISEYVMAGGWAGTAALATAGSPWLWLPLALSGLVLAVSRALRLQPAAARARASIAPQSLSPRA